MNEDFISQYKQLWKKIFKDNDEFIESYFSNFLNTDSFFYFSENNIIKSALLSCNYRWNFEGDILKFAYLSGILTEERSRGKGLASELIKHTLKNICLNGFNRCGLIAADDSLVKYYAKLGFIKCKEKDDKIFRTEYANTIHIKDYSIQQLNKIPDSIFNNRYLQFNNNSVLHDKNTLNLYNNDYYKIFIAEKQGRIETFLIVTLENNETNILYSYFENTETRNAILSWLVDKYNRNVRTVGTRNRMLRIINAEHILQLYASKHQKKTIFIRITDDIIENNNKTFYIKDGRIQSQNDNTDAIIMSIDELTDKLFFEGQMFLMLDR